MDNQYYENAKVFKAFCDETRLLALALLQSGEKCACELLEQVNVSQSTLSHHMKILLESGIVISRKEGKWTYYAISQEGSENAVALLKKITSFTAEQVENKKECCAWVKNVVPQIAVAVKKV